MAAEKTVKTYRMNMKVVQRDATFFVTVEEDATNAWDAEHRASAKLEREHAPTVAVYAVSKKRVAVRPFKN